MYGFLIWQEFSLNNPILRQQFFLSCVCTWTLLGNGVAFLLSSAGPCYFEKVYEVNNVFFKLDNYLSTVNKTIPLQSSRLQELLWYQYKNDIYGVGSGISAFPSMHVAMTFLMVMLSWQINSALGVVSLFFLIVIMVGSVHLGWHYAVDGYVSILLTFPIWHISGMAAKYCLTPSNN